MSFLPCFLEVKNIQESILVRAGIDASYYVGDTHIVSGAIRKQKSVSFFLIKAP